jgi:hypothetical protein
VRRFWIPSLGGLIAHARLRPRLTVAVLALGCVLPLLAPSQSWASGLVVPPHLTAAAPSRPDMPSSEGAFLPVLLVLALNSAAMVIRLVSSPPSWLKD